MKKKLDTMKILHSRNKNLMRRIEELQDERFNLECEALGLQIRVQELEAVVKYQDELLKEKKK